MKVNFILPFTFSTGGIKVVFEYCNRLKDRGHDIVVYIPMIAYKFDNKGIIGIIKRVKSSIANTIKRGNKVNWFNLNVKVKLVPKINNTFIRDADIVIATAWPTAYDVYNLDNKKGKKVYFIQGYEIWSGEKIEVDNSYRLPLKQIVVSKSLKDIMEEQFKQTKVDIIYSGIDENEFYNDSTKTKKKDKTICIMYSDVECKGYKYGIEALKNIKKAHKNVRVKIFGMKKIKEDIEGVEYYVNPSREELRNIYSESDIYIFPSVGDSWGLTSIEAMACKCAVVGTDVGCISEIGVHRQNCMKSKAEDAKLIEDNINELLENNDLLLYLSENGYKTSKKLRWNNSVIAFEEIITSLQQIN